MEFEQPPNITNIPELESLIITTEILALPYTQDGNTTNLPLIGFGGAMYDNNNQKNSLIPLSLIIYDEPWYIGLNNSYILYHKAFTIDVVGCPGDSGRPLIVKEVESSVNLFGIVTGTDAQVATECSKKLIRIEPVNWIAIDLLKPLW